MILLDTNVISEVMRPAPDQRVIRWLNEAEASHIHLSTISVAEILFGLDLLPVGRRRQGLEERFESFLEQAFAHRLPPFDDAAARHYGPLMVRSLPSPDPAPWPWPHGTAATSSPAGWLCSIPGAEPAWGGCRVAAWVVGEGEG